MKQTRIAQMQDKISCMLGPERGPEAARYMLREFQRLCADCSDLPEEMTRHAHNNILPVVSAFHTLMEEGMPREEAAKAAGDAFLELMQAPAQAIRKLLKLPGLYRLMPWIWKTAMPRLFSESAGFQFKFYPADNRQVRFDMLACPYLQVCKRLGCPELAPVFCTTDDVCYGHMHPKLIWNRTKTLARGGDLCDFDLYIPKKK